MDPYDPRSSGYDHVCGFVPCRDENCERTDGVHPAHRVAVKDQTWLDNKRRIRNRRAQRQARARQAEELKQQQQRICPTCSGKGWVTNWCVACETCLGHGKLSFALYQLMRSKQDE